MSKKMLMTSLVLALLLGCAENRASFFILDMKAPTDECVIPSDLDAEHFTQGRWDIGLAGSYFVHPLAVNEMTSSTKLNPLAAESNAVAVEGAKITILDPAENKLIDEFFVYGAATVSPEGGATSMGFAALDRATYNAIANASAGRLLNYDTLCGGAKTSLIIVKIRLVGKTSGGSNMETPSFLFPVSVCCGCLAYFPPDTWDDTLNTYKCKGEETTTEPCLTGQNKDTDCRLCAASFPALCDPTTEGFTNPWL